MLKGIGSWVARAARLLPRAWAASMFGRMMGEAMDESLKDPKLGARVSAA